MVCLLLINPCSKLVFHDDILFLFFIYVLLFIYLFYNLDMVDHKFILNFTEQVEEGTCHVHGDGACNNVHLFVQLSNWLLVLVMLYIDMWPWSHNVPS